MATSTAPASPARFATGGKAGSGKGGAGEPGDGESGAPTAKKPSKLKSKKFILGVVGVLVVGYVGYGMAFPAKPGPPVGGDVVTVDPTTLNLQNGHYLKIAISIQLVKGKATSAAFFPSQASELTIDEFSDRTVDSLASNTARQKLTAELLTKIKAAYPGEVFDVFVTQFVTQ